MSNRRFGIIEIPQRSINSLVFLLALYLMIIMTVFNGNKYLAGLSFVWVPSVLLLAASIIVKKKMLNRLNIYAILLAGSAALSTKLSTIELTQSTYINLQFCILSFIVVSSVILSDADFSSLYRFYVTFSFLVCLVLIFNYIFSIGMQVFSDRNVRVTIQYFGIYKDVNYLSAFVVPSFAFYLYKGLFTRNRLCLIKAGIVFISMFIAGSRACFLAMLLSGLILIAKMIFDKNHKVNKPVILLLLFVVVILTYFIVSKSTIFERTTDFENYSNNSRVLIWSYALNGFYANPIIGSGVESGTYFSLLGTRWKTHNCFIDVLTGQGLVGSVILLLMFLNVFKVKKENRYFVIAVAICFFVPLFFVNGYECATFWMPMMLLKFLSDKCKERDDILDILTF